MLSTIFNITKIHEKSPFTLGQELLFSWKLCKQWQKEEPPSRAIPFNPLLTLGMAGLAIATGLDDVAACILLAFDAILRLPFFLIEMLH